MKTLKIIGIVAVVATVASQALELRQSRYELQLMQSQRDGFERQCRGEVEQHIAFTAHDREEIARLRAQTNVVAAH